MDAVGATIINLFIEGVTQQDVAIIYLLRMRNVGALPVKIVVEDSNLMKNLRQLRTENT